MGVYLDIRNHGAHMFFRVNLLVEQVWETQIHFHAFWQWTA